MIGCNSSSPRLMEDLKGQIDSLIAELQEMRDNLAQCSCNAGNDAGVADEI